MVKVATTLAKLTAHVRSPRSQTEVYRDYNTLRQNYILEATRTHFHMREDDPAPLYGKTLLDAGCGASTIAEFLALSGAEITAIDKNPAQVAKAEASARAFGAPIQFIATPVESLVNTSQTFDVILALDLLEDAEDPAKLLWVLKQLLAPGGILILSHISRTPKAWFLHVFLSATIYRRTHRTARAMARFHTPRQLVAFCTKVGLTLTNIAGLRLSTSKQRWKLSPTADTRYMATATHHA